MLHPGVIREDLLFPGENTCIELGGEEEATDTPIETNPIIHFHRPQELMCELRIGSF